MSKPLPQFDKAQLLRRAVFFVVLLSLTLLQLLVLFRGLDSPQAMDQAQIGRQVARGDGLVTRFIRPLEHHLAETNAAAPVPFSGLHDTYHAPLNPLVLGAVFKLVGADDFDAWAMGEDELVYPLDRVVALVSTMFFLMAIGVTYLLASRVFDGRIAGVTALLMLLCNLMWEFSLSGLPQMLMLLLLSCGLYFAYRAVEDVEEGRKSLVYPVIASLFFGLMVLAHWLAVWMFFGYIVYAAIAFRPRGFAALSALGIVILFSIYPVWRMMEASGELFGVARYVFYNGLASGSEEAIMRTQDLGSTPVIFDGLLLKIVGTTLVQFSGLIPFLGGILAAPVFFVALLYPFKRNTIASFRWLILLMWSFAAIGMAIFGIDQGTEIHPNQIHILFAPIMAAYGLAFLSILWSRLRVVGTTPFLRNAHYFAIVALSAAPMLLTLPKEIRLYMTVSDQGGFPQWPPYYPPVLNLGLSQWVDRHTERPEIVITDQPWATAWYADVHSLWLPRSKRDFDALDRRASDLGTPFAGFLITPSSREAGSSAIVQAKYGDFAALVFDGRIASVTRGADIPSGISLYTQAPGTREIARRFPIRTPLLGQEILYYSVEPPENQR